MEISFKSKKLRESLTNPRLLLKTYGERAKKIKQRMEEIASAPNLEVLGKLPGPDCHELSGDRKGQLAVRISGNFRIIFEPDHNPLPVKDDGGLEWQKVTSIRISEVIDYH